MENQVTDIRSRKNQNNSSVNTWDNYSINKLIKGICTARMNLQPFTMTRSLANNIPKRSTITTIIISPVES